MVKATNFWKNEKGFTLIELVVVVIILGILALVLVPNVIGRVEEAKKSRNQSDLEAIATAVRLYYIDNGECPENLGDLKDYGIKEGAKDPWKGAYAIENNKNGTITITSNSTEGAQITINVPKESQNP